MIDPLIESHTVHHKILIKKKKKWAIGFLDIYIQYFGYNFVSDN